MEANSLFLNSWYPEISTALLTSKLSPVLHLINYQNQYIYNKYNTYGDQQAQHFPKLCSCFPTKYTCSTGIIFCILAIPSAFCHPQQDISHVFLCTELHLSLQKKLSLMDPLLPSLPLAFTCTTLEIKLINQTRTTTSEYLYMRSPLSWAHKDR